MKEASEREGERILKIEGTMIVKGNRFLLGQACGSVFSYSLYMLNGIRRTFLFVIVLFPIYKTITSVNLRKKRKEKCRIY